ncbi:MAG: SIMPL domain-containing protein, partial [Myxococcota bacterium]
MLIVQIRSCWRVLLMTVFAVVLSAPTAWSGGQNRFEVVGQAELEVNPDVVDVRFTITEMKKTPSEAVAGLSV